MIRPVFLLLILVMNLLPASAQAWGTLGHRISAQIADAELTPRTRQQVMQLLDGESLADASTFMDRQRDSLAQQFANSPRWHYDNAPVCGSATYCRDGHCASAQIRRWQTVLADTRADHATRALALRLLVHMVGDLHQPLHASDHDDRGGNEVLVQLSTRDQPVTLHELLDTTLVRQFAGKRSAKQVAKQLRQRFVAQLPAWQRGTAAQWRDESHAVSMQHVYGALPGFACHASAPDTPVLLDAAYVQQLTARLPEQLAKAGARIAWLLNQALP